MCESALVSPVPDHVTAVDVFINKYCNSWETQSLQTCMINNSVFLVKSLVEFNESKKDKLSNEDKLVEFWCKITEVFFLLQQLATFNKEFYLTSKL